LTCKLRKKEGLKEICREGLRGGVTTCRTLPLKRGGGRILGEGGDIPLGEALKGDNEKTGILTSRRRRGRKRKTARTFLEGGLRGGSQRRGGEEEGPFISDEGLGGRGELGKYRSFQEGRKIRGAETWTRVKKTNRKESGEVDRRLCCLTRLKEG